MSSITMDITMVIANSAASAPEMMVGNFHSHAYERKYQGKIIDCMHQNRPSITTTRALGLPAHDHIVVNRMILGFSFVKFKPQRDRRTDRSGPCTALGSADER